MSWLPQKDFEFIYERVPRLCVDLVIYIDYRGVYLTRRTQDPHLGKWHLPGGAIRFKESIQNAIVRIAKDELGIYPDHPKFSGLIEFPNETRDGKPYHSVSIVYEVRSGSAPIGGEWFKSIPSPMIPEHDTFLRSYKIHQYFK